MHTRTLSKPLRRRIAVLVSAVTLCGAAQAEDLLQVYQDALKFDATYAAAQAANRAAQERVPQAKAGLKTTLDFNANAGVLAVNRKDFGTSEGGQANYTLQLAHPLWRAQNKIQVQQAETSLSQFEAQLSQAKQDLALRVSQAYFDNLLAQDNVALSQAQKTAIGEQLAQAKRNFEVGTATITDTHEAQARYDLAVAKEIADQNDLEIKQRALEQLIGRRAPALAVLNEGVLLPPPNPNNMQTWVDLAESVNPQVQAAKSVYEVARQEIERNRAAYKPTVDFVSSFNHQAYTSDELSSSKRAISGQAGVQLNIPIIEGGLRQSRVREAVANSERARQDLENAKRVSALAARQAFLAVNSGVAQVKAFEQALVSTRSALDSTKLGQEVGVRTSIDVLNAQQQLFQARRDLFAARYNTIVNHLRLQSAAGALAEDDLINVNKQLVAAAAGASNAAKGTTTPAPAPTAPAANAKPATAAKPGAAPVAPTSPAAPKAVPTTPKAAPTTRPARRPR